MFLWWLLLLLAEPTANEQFFPTQLIITQTAFQNSQVFGGIPFGPTVVELKDAAYNTVAINDGRFITATLLSEGQSSLAGDVVLRFGDTALSGIATFSSLEISKICVQCRLHFECQGLQVDSEPFDVVQSPPASIRVVALPPDGVVNVDLHPTPAIQLVDSGGNLITTQFSANISKAAGFGQLRNRRNILTNTSRPDLENTVFFTEIFFDAASEGGSYSVRFDARIPGGVVVSTVVSSLRVTTPVRRADIQTDFAVANQTAMVPFAIQPVITVRDQFGYLVTADAGSIVVTATIVGGDPAAQLQGSTEVRTKQGVATFTDLAIDKVGRRFSVVFSHPLFTTFSTDVFDVFTGPIANFEVTVQPATIVAGQAFAAAPTVNVLDAGRNLFPGAAAVSLSLAENSEGARLLGDPSVLLVNAVNGVATFPGVSLDRIGTSFRLLFQSGQEFSVLSEPFQVVSSSPSRVVMTAQPGSALRGIFLSVAPVVSLLDMFGNVVTDESSVMQVGAELIGQLEQATLAGTTSVAFQNGSAIFSDLSVNNPGLDYILRFTANQTFVTESQPFTITGLVADLDILVQPGGATGGAAFRSQPVLALIDINRQIVATASNVIEATLIPVSDSVMGTLSPIQARAESSFGVVTFTNLAVDIAGSGYKISFRTLLRSSISADSAPFDVMVGPPSRLSIVVQPANYIAATSLDPSPSITAVDAGGNIVIISSTVHVAVIWRGETLQSFTIALTDGLASINQTIPLAREGYRLVFALSIGGLELSVQSRTFTVSPGVPASLTIDVEPIDAIVGVDFFRDPVLGVRDAGGNLVPAYTSPIVVSRGAGPSGSYPIGNLSVTPENGVATFANMQISDTAKIYQLEFRTERLGVVLTALSSVFSITLEPRRLRLIRFPERAIGGERFTVNTVAGVLDSENTPVTALPLPFNASVAPPAQLFGTKVKEASDGVVEFTDLAIDLAGLHDIVISYAGYSASFPVEVDVGEPDDLTIFTQPVNCMSNTKFFISPSVRFLDKGGNVVPGVSDIVAVSVLQNSRASSVEGTTSLAATNGIATFVNLRMAGLGNGFTLLFSSGNREVESDRFSVQGEVTSLALVHFPAGVILDQNINPFIKVAVLDEALNVIDGGNWRPPFVAVRVSLPTLSYPGISTPNIAIAGTTTAVVHRGVAVFTDLRVTADTSSYQGVLLEFTTNISTPAIRSPFFSPSFAEDELVKTQEPRALQTTGVALQPFPVLQVRDGLSAMVRGSAAYCLVTLTGFSVPATLAGRTRIFAAAGVFTFTDLSIQKASEPTEQYTLVFTVEGRADIPAVASAEFKVIIGPPAIIEFQSGLLFESSGLAFAQQPCIALQDAGTNLIQTQASVSATLLGPSASTLTGTIAAASGGLAAFTNMAISQVVPGATYRIAFSSDGLELVSPPFEGVSGDPAHLEVMSQPSDVTSRIIFSTPPVVRVMDAGGTLVRDLISVTASLVDRSGVIQPDPLLGGEATTFNGTATFDQLRVDPAGEGFSLHFASGLANMRSRSFSVSVGTGVRLALASTPSPSVFGVNLYPVPSALVLDAGENWVSTASVSVTIVLIVPEGHLEEPPSVLSGETQRVMQLGVANFVGITINNAGEGFRLEVQSPGLESDTTEPFDVSGPPTKLVVTRQPSGRGASGEVSADRPLSVQPVVTVVDYDGRVVRYGQMPATISASLNVPGTLTGTLEADVIRGQASFKDLQILQKIDAAVISFHYRGPLLEASVNAAPFRVLSGPPHHLQITGQPGSSTRGLPLGLQPMLRILDEWGNDASWFASSVDVQLFQGIDDVTAYLDGTRTAAFDPENSGIAEFLDLLVNLEGDGFAMHFQSGGFRAQSQTFNIKQGPPFAMVSKSYRVPAGVLNFNQGVLEPQPLIHVVDRGYFKVDSMDGSNCAGSDCRVSIRLVCCPRNFLGDYVGAGTLRGTTSVITQQGVAAFSDVQIDAEGDYTLTFIVEEIEGISPRFTMDVANIRVQQIVSLGIATQPSHAILGLPLRYQPIIQILDASSQIVSGTILNVSVAIAAGVGCSDLSGTTSVMVEAGVASFTDLSIGNFAGGSNCQLDFISQNPSLVVVSDSFTISFGPCSLSVSTQPGGVEAGAPFQLQPVVQFRELGGLLLTSESGQLVSVELFRNGGETSCGVQSCSQELIGNTMAFNFDGEARFTDLRMDTPNTDGYVLMFTMGRFAAFSNLFNVSIGPAAQLFIVRQPSDARINTDMEPFVQVAIQDAGGNVVTTATDTVTASVLPAASFGIVILGGVIAAQNGIAEFSAFQLSKPALMLSLQFSSGQMSVSSTSFSVHDAPAQLVLREFNTEEKVAGTRIVPEPQLALVDRLGFITSSDSASEVVALLSMGGASFQASNFTNATLFRGIAQFENIRILSAGRASIRFFLASSPSIFVDSPSFSVRAGAASSLQIVQQPQSIGAGLLMFPFPEVQILDDWSNTIQSGDDIVEVCVSNNLECIQSVRLKGTLRAGPVTGRVIFANLIVDGPPSLQNHLLFQIVNVGAAILPVQSDAFELEFGLPQLSITQQPTSAALGSPLQQQPVLAVTDASLTVLSYGIDYLTVTATLESFSVSGATLTDSSGPCPCIARFRGGIAEFDGLEISDAGQAFAIRFSSPDLKLKDVVSEPFIVTAAAMYLQVVGTPLQIPYRGNFDVEVRALDPNGNLVGVPSISVQLRTTSGVISDSLLGAKTLEALSGSAMFRNLSVSMVGGGYFLQFTALDLIGKSNIFTVTQRDATAVLLGSFPDKVFAGQTLPMPPMIIIADEFGSPSAFNDTVSVRVEHENNAFTQTINGVAISSGQGTFQDLIFQNAGTRFVVTVTASVLDLGIQISGSSNPFDVVPGPLAQLVVTAQPSNGIVGRPLAKQPVVAAQDAVGNVLIGFDRTITASLQRNFSSADAVMTGTPVLLAREGVVAFTDFNIGVEGTYSFVISTKESCGVQIETNTFTITGDVASISLTQTPSGAEGGSVFVTQPELVLLDQSGDVVMAADQAVFVQTCDQSAEVLGTTTLSTSTGSVKFTDLTINTDGAYTLCFVYQMLTANTPITVTIGDARFISLIVQPVILLAETEWSQGSPIPQVRLTDAGGNVIPATTTTFLYVQILDDRTRIDSVKIRNFDSLTYSTGQVQVRANAITALKINRPARQIRFRLSIIGTSGFVVSQAFDVVGGKCAQVTVIIQPGDAILGEVFKRPPSVQVEDIEGNVASWVGNLLQLQIGSSHFNDAILSGCETSQSPIDGVISFIGCSISCTVAAGTTGCLGNDYTLSFRISNCDSNNYAVDSDTFHLSQPANAITVSALSADSIAATPFDPQPFVSFFNIPCGPEDFCSVRMSDATRMVTARLVNPPNDANLTGTTSVAIVDGVATFTNLAISEALTAYNISFSTSSIAAVYVQMDVVVGPVAALRVTSPPTLSQPAAAFGCSVSLFDAGGNLVDASGEQFAITVSLLDDLSKFYGAVLDTSQASLTQVSALGVATWSGLTVYLAPVVYTFVFSGTTVEGVSVSTMSEKIALGAGTLFELRLVTQPESRESNVSLNEIVVELVDEGGNRIVDTNVFVTASVSRGGGTLSGLTSILSSDGYAIFPNLTVAYSSGDSHHQLQFSVSSFFVRSSPFFIHLAPTQIVFRTWPSEASAVSAPLPQQPQIELRDSLNNRAYGSTSYYVRATLEEGGSSALTVFTGNRVAPAVNGVATFTNLIISQAGSYTLSFSQVNSSSVAAISSNSVTVSAGPATSLVIQSDYQPGASTNNATKYAGVSLPLQPRVRLLDDGGGVPLPSIFPVIASIGPPAGGVRGEEVLYGTSVILPDEATGIATFSDLAVNLAGTFVLTFRAGTLSVSSETFKIEVGPIAQISFRVQPGNSVFGTSLGQQPAVLLLDAGGNRVKGTPWLHIDLEQGTALGSSLEGCSEEYAALDSGEVVFQGCSVAGTTSGVHSFVVHTVLTVFNQVKGTTDTLVLESDPFYVSGPPSRLEIHVPASNGRSPDPFPSQPVIAVVDSTSVLVRSFEGNVSVSTELDQGNLTGTTTLGVSDGMVAFTDLRLLASGRFVLQFQAADLGFVLSQNISITPGLPNSLVPVNVPSQSVAGSILGQPSLPLVAFVTDFFGNSIGNDSQVRLTMNCSRPGPCLNGTLVARTLEGRAIFSDVFPHQAGVMQLSFSLLGTISLEASVVLEVLPGPLASLVFMVQPPTAVFVRTSLDPNPVVALHDSYGNQLTTNEGSFTFYLATSLLPGAALLGDLEAVVVNGVVTVSDVSVNAAGVDFHLGCRGSGFETQSRGFSVYEQHCCLHLVQMPQTVFGGVSFEVHPVLNLVDQADDVVAVSGEIVSVALEFGAATLSGQTQVVAEEGRAVFQNLSIDKTGTFRLVFSSSGSHGFATAVSDDVIVLAGPATRLHIYQQPGGFASGGLAFPIQPVVLVMDAGGNIANEAAVVTASLQNTSSGATMDGDTEVMSGGLFGAPLETNETGVVTFQGLSIDLVGTYSLVFSSTDLEATTSVAFFVERGQAARLHVATQPADAISGRAFLVQPQLQVQDAGGNLVEPLTYAITSSVQLHSTRYELLSEVILGGNAVAVSQSGFAHFTDLSVDVPGEFCILRFTSPGLSQVDSHQFAVGPAAPLSGCPPSSNFFSDCGPSTDRAFFLHVQTAPSETRSNETMNPAPVVVLRDHDGMQIDKEGDVRVVLVAPAVGLHSSPARMSQGIAQFTDLRIDAVGTGIQLRFLFEEVYADSGVFDVVAGAVFSLKLGALPLEWVVQRVLPPFSISLLDAGSNIAADFGSCTSISLSKSTGPASGQLSGTTLVTVTGGTASFSDIKFSEAGHFTIRAACSDDTAAILPVVSEILSVLPYGVPSQLIFVAAPADAIASFDSNSALNPYYVQSTPSVAMVDAVGNVVKGFQGIFRARQNTTSTGITLGAGDSIVAYPVLGAAEFEQLFFEISTASFQRGVISVLFQSTATSLTQTLTGEVRINANPEQIAISLPSSPVAGEGFAATLRFSTAGGTPVSIYTGSVDVFLVNSTSNNTIPWAFPQDQATITSGGTVTLSGLIARSPGTYQLLLRCSRPTTFLPELVAASGSFTVVAGQVYSLAVLVQPAGCVGGVVCTTQPVIQVLDRVGNVVPATGTDVTASIVGDSNGEYLSGTLVAAGDSFGVSFVDLVIAPSGYHVMNFSGPGYVLSDPVLVLVGEKAKAKIFVEPIGLEAGVPFLRQPIALAADFGGNWVAGITDIMQVEFVCGVGCTQFGNFTAPTKNGVAGFTDLGVNYAGQIQIRFRLSSTFVCGAESCWDLSSSLDVRPGQLAQLVVRSNISEYICSAVTISPAVEIEVQDASGNLLSTGGTYVVSVSLPANPEGLSGQLSVETVDGIASFGDLSVAEACSLYSSDPVSLCYYLIFTSSSVSTTSSSFSILAGAPVGIQFNESPQDTAVGHRASISSLSLADSQGNPFVELPAGFVNLCGGNTALDPAKITAGLATEQLMGNAVILGQAKKQGAGASVDLLGVSVNWKVASCPSSLDCRVESEDDYKIMRIRASANYGSYVADSGTFMVDVAQPVNFQVTRTSHTSILVTWNAPFHGPIPSTYLLRFRTIGGVGGVPTEIAVPATTFTLSGIWYGDLYEFTLCSQSIFGERCAVKPPAPVVAAAVEPAQTVEVVYVNEGGVIISWTEPAIGPSPESYQVTSTKIPGGFETVLLSGVNGSNASLTGLEQNTTYVLKLYPKSFAGDFHAPTGPSTAEFVLTAAAESVTVGCPSGVCTGTSLQVAWSRPTGVMIQPKSYRIKRSQIISNGTAVQSQVDVADTVTSVLLGNLEKGRPVTIRVLANNRVFPTFYAPSAYANVVPVSPPSSPAELKLRMVGTTLVQIDWTPPLDSGDGTPTGIRVVSYLLDYKASGVVSFDPAVEIFERSFTVQGLQSGTNYTFRVRAQTAPTIGTICADQCASIPPLALIGQASERSLVFGRVPVWDELQAPPIVDPPTLYNLFVGNLFSFQVRALSLEAGQVVTISATGLSDCGAELVANVVGNPSTSTLVFLPSVQQMDKTFWICFVATDSYGAFSDQRCLRLFVASPRPTFTLPDQALGDPDAATLEAVAGCELSIRLEAHDLTSGMDVSAQEAGSRGYLVRIESDTSIAVSQYGEAASPSLPAGAILADSDVEFANPTSRMFHWTPARGQESFTYLLCFRLLDSLATYNSASAQSNAKFCTRVRVARCKYCMKAGDSLYSIAQEWGTEWLNLWAGNDLLTQPGQTSEKTEVRLGPLLSASNQDSLVSLATKFSVSVQDILAWNPDLHAQVEREIDLVLFDGQEICVLPSTCVH